MCGGKEIYHFAYAGKRNMDRKAGRDSFSRVGINAELIFEKHTPVIFENYLKKHTNL